MSRFTAADERFMRRALALAERGRGQVEPNPLVGCVIVRGEQVIGSGHHRRFGGPHAEIEALERCTASPRGATVYVTLEPCAHHGKTPPCVDALIAAGVARVVAAATDPNPQVHGRGLRALRRAGLQVDAGLLRADAERLIAPFSKLIRTGRPWVILKWAQSLDGKIATRTGDSKWISSVAARAHAHGVRGCVDAVLVGAETVLRDDPQLTCRLAAARRVATRVVLDTRLRTPASTQLVRTARTTPTWIFCGRSAAASKRAALESRGCRVTPVAVRQGRVSLGAVLDALGAAGMTNLLVEGGGAVLGAFLDEGLADEVLIYAAMSLIGGEAAPGPLNGIGPASVDDAWRITPTELLPTSGGFAIRGLLACEPASHR